MAKKKTEEVEEILENVEEAVVEQEQGVEAMAEVGAPIEAAAETTETAGAEPTEKSASKTTEAEATDETSDEDSASKKGKRAEKIGVVSSDKMTKTVVVRVDRLVKHPIYRKYVRKRKKFMAHDEMGAKIGDKVRIVETRPLSARKRWRVVEIIQKAEL